jgi:hypothetical protein
MVGFFHENTWFFQVFETSDTGGFSVLIFSKKKASDFDLCKKKPKTKKNWKFPGVASVIGPSLNFVLN